VKQAQHTMHQLWSHYSMAEGYRKRTSALSRGPMDFTYLIHQFDSIQPVQCLHLK